MVLVFGAFRVLEGAADLKDLETLGALRVPVWRVQETLSVITIDALVADHSPTP